MIDLQSYYALKEICVPTYKDDLTKRDYLTPLGTINPYHLDIPIERAEKAGDFTTANLMIEYRDWGKVEEKLRIEAFRKDMIDKQDAANEIIEELRANNYRIKYNKYNATLVIYHGTSKENAKKILEEGRFDEMSFFNHAKNSSCFGNAKCKDYGSSIIGIEADPRDIHFNSGSGEIEAEVGLIRDSDGIWKSPDRIKTTV